jgi:hypothetical protein
MADTNITTTTAGATEPWISEARRIAGVGAFAVSLGGWITWFGWRAQCLALEPVCMAAFVLELAALIGSGMIVGGLLAADHPRPGSRCDRNDPHRFAVAVAGIIGRTRSIDLHHDVRWLVRHVRDDRHRTSSDLAMGAVLLDGARRLATVAVVTIGLLIGAPPVPMPTWWAMGAVAIAVSASSVAIVLLGGGRIRFGDRTRWTFAAVGELFSRQDRTDLAPRRWIGAVAAVVVVSIAVALRGISDRWTHGLSPMDQDDRRAAMVFALFLAIGALYTLATTSPPQLDNEHVVARRLEERTARHSAIGGAVAVGLVGLIAGILPGNVDAAHDDPLRIEDVTERQMTSVGPGNVDD